MADVTCSIGECDREVVARGWCGRHYQKWRKYGDPEMVMLRRNVCRVDGCDRLAFGHLLCQLHYGRWRAHGDPLWQPPTYAECVVAGCARLPRSRTSPLCEMHYYRRRRRGDPLTVREAKRRCLSTHGYVLVYRPGHDLSHATGWAYEHRVVLQEMIGNGPQLCHWCGVTLYWELSYPFDMSALVVDHVDGDKQNNDPLNLVASCNPCNVNRDS